MLRGCTDPRRAGRIKDDILASWVTDREEHLSGVLAQSSAASHTANDFLKAKADRRDPSGPRKSHWRNELTDRGQEFTGDVMSPGNMAQAVEHQGHLTDGRPHELLSGWLPHLPDRADVDGLNRVWDYRWAMPALLTTITIRLAVLTAFSTGERVLHELFRDEVAGTSTSSTACSPNAGTDCGGSITCRRNSGTTSPRPDGSRWSRSTSTAARISAGSTPQRHHAQAVQHRRGAGQLLGLLQLANPFDLTWVDHNVRRFGEHWWICCTSGRVWRTCSSF